MKLELLRPNFVNEILLKRIFKEQRTKKKEKRAKSKGQRAKRKERKEKNKYERVNVFPIHGLTSLYFS